MAWKRLLACSILVPVLVLSIGCPQKPGALTVNLAPDEAVAAAAQWQVDGGAWQNSGATVSGLSAGDHRVTFSEAPGWYAPATYTATITAGQTSSVTRTYMPGDAQWEPDSFTYSVTTAPNTVQIDESHLGLLMNSDTELNVYTFNAAGLQTAGLVLAVGKPLIIHGIAVRKISSVTTVGGNLVVETEFVPLNEVFTDGTIAWDYGVEFTPDKIKSIEIAGKEYAVPKDGTPINISFEIGEFKYEIKATLDTETSTYEFKVTKGIVSTVEGRFVASGKITRFRSQNNFELGGGQLQQWGSNLSGMRGDVTLDLVVAGSGRDVIDYKLPVPIMKIPFLVGPIPVVLGIKIQFVINGSVPVDGSSRVRTGFTYDSDLGLSFNGTSVSAGGSLAGLTFGDDDMHETGASGAVGMNFGVGFPRVELSILGDSIVPWAQTAFLVGGTFTFTPPCQTADAQFLGAMGYKLGLFGFDLLSGKHTLFSHTKKLLRSGQCPEGSKSDEEMEAEDMLLGASPLF